MKKILIIIVFLFTAISAQKKDADLILDQVKNNFERIKDYQVDVSIKVDVDFIKVPDMKATLYYKYPDKVHLESDAFAMLPKSGMNFSPATLLSGDYTSFYEKEEVLDGIKMSVIKIIPLGETDIALSTLWIDTENKRISKIESTTKMQGTYSIQLGYDSMEYPLPVSMIFSMNMDKMNLPKAMTGETNDEPKKRKEKTAAGSVFVNYSDYKINRGIPDSIFEDKNKQ